MFLGFSDQQQGLLSGGIRQEKLMIQAWNTGEEKEEESGCLDGKPLRCVLFLHVPSFVGLKIFKGRIFNGFSDSFAAAKQTVSTRLEASDFPDSQRIPFENQVNS